MEEQRTHSSALQCPCLCLGMWSVRYWDSCPLPSGRVLASLGVASPKVWIFLCVPADSDMQPGWRMVAGSVAVHPRGCPRDAMVAASCLLSEYFQVSIQVTQRYPRGSRPRRKVITPLLIDTYTQLYLLLAEGWKARLDSVVTVAGGSRLSRQSSPCPITWHVGFSIRRVLDEPRVSTL